MHVTTAQAAAIERIRARWHHITPHIIDSSDLVIDDTITYYVGVWVGGAPGTPGALYLGIEPDGYTHS